MRRVYPALLCLLWSLTAGADRVSQAMISAMDALCRGDTQAESSIDWENLQVHSARLKQDLHAYYGGLNSTQKATFRKAFTASFSRSFRAQAGTALFSTAVRVPGKFIVHSEGTTPSIEGCGPGPFRIEFRRLGGQLKMVELWL